MRKRFLPVLFVVLAAALPAVARAHEVYVLSRDAIARDVAEPPLNLFRVAVSHEYIFLVSVFLGILLLLCVLGVSLSRRIERWLDPALFLIKPYAGHIAQFTIGIALVASAHYGALFGTELPMGMLFGAHASLVTAALYVAGASLLLGLFPRIGALLAALIYLAAFASYGSYLISYLTYFGEAMVVLFFGGGYALATFGRRWSSGHLAQHIAKRKHFFLRIAFAASLIYAALYAKLIHGALALDTVNTYHLTNYFHFDPLFVVLGAFLVEMTIGLFFLLGFELRFTSLFFLTFLTMSLVFFGETVWPHFVLIGTAVAMFVHGYDEYTVEHLWYKPGRREPVL